RLVGRRGPQGGGRHRSLRRPAMTTYEHVHDGLEAMVAAADAGVASGLRWAGLETLSYRPTFIGRAFAGWADVKTQLGEAWPEGPDEVQWMLFELRKVALRRVTCQRRRPRFTEEGDEVDHDRLRAGQACWRAVRRESAAGPQAFCLVTDMGTPANKASLDIL